MFRSIHHGSLIGMNQIHSSLTYICFFPFSSTTFLSKEERSKFPAFKFQPQDLVFCSTEFSSQVPPLSLTPQPPTPIISIQSSSNYLIPVNKNSNLKFFFSYAIACYMQYETLQLYLYLFSFLGIQEIYLNLKEHGKCTTALHYYFCGSEWELSSMNINIQVKGSLLHFNTIRFQ